MNASLHIQHHAAGGHPGGNDFQNGGIGGTVIAVLAQVLGFIQESPFVLELLQVAITAGVGAAASFSVSYLLHKRFKK
jgi:hypothetical protein